MKTLLTLLVVFVTTLSSSFAAKLELTWTDNSNNEQGFKIYRAPTISGPFTLLATVPANTVLYLDENLAAGTFYAYRVTAFNTAGESLPTVAVGATTKSVDPTPTPVQKPTGPSLPKLREVE